MSSLVSILRMSVRPEGSPIMVVPPPMRAMGLLPAICSRFIRHRAIKWPTWQAVGGAVKADVEGGLAVVDHLADFLLVGDLGEQAPGLAVLRTLPCVSVLSKKLIFLKMPREAFWEKEKPPAFSRRGR